jgi:hypothetical protein
MQNLSRVPLFPLLALFLPLLALALLAACGRQSESGRVLDEARLAGRNESSFPRAGEDYFHEMDGGLALGADEVKGRNLWLVWTAGNDRFWNRLTQYSAGGFDLLKVISSHPALGFSRANRWSYFGLVNEPCFTKPTAPDRSRHGLWLDVRARDCPPDPFEDEGRYPGVALGSRGKPLGNGAAEPVGSYYGYATGIIGLRLFPNPDFDAQAAKDWDPERYYTDPSYYNRPDLVRPYRVGMACAFCHVGPSPTKPPADPESPAFANLSSTVGAQYLRPDRLFIVSPGEPQGRGSFLSQLLSTYRPGSMDTSLISTDNINNPRAVNALYDFASRLGVARQLWHERLAGGELRNQQFAASEGALSGLYDQADGVVRTPHLLADGADSVGLLGALNRNYLNIGVFSEEWLTHFNPLVGGKMDTPLTIATAENNSVYWQATRAGTPDIARFLLAVAKPDRLKDAPGGNLYLGADAKTLARGKEVFADYCARCHSSKGPTPPPDLNLDADRCSGTLYPECFRRYWTWTQSDQFKTLMRAMVTAPDFLDGNYLSTDARIPVTLLRTNVCASLATNALAGDIWDNFSSHSYKQLPSVGTVTLYDPFTGERVPYEMPAGGRGYTRVPSLIGIWSTAPFLLNNSIGPFDPDPSVAARMKVFQASIEQLLWPEKRPQDSLPAGKIPGVIDRTTQRSRLTIPAALVPEPLEDLRPGTHGWLSRFLHNGGDIELGPIPQGMPVGLLANLGPSAETDDQAVQAAYRNDLRKALLRLKTQLESSAGAPDDEVARKLSGLAKLSRCPDFVVNRGHYFGTAQFNDQQGLSKDEQAFGQEPELGDEDKRALIAFLATF